MGSEVKKREHVYEYRPGDTIQGDTIEKVYFANDDKKYIIIKNTQREIKFYGMELPQNIAPLLAQCGSLIEFVDASEKLRNRVDYEKALAINEALLGNVEKSEIILFETINKIKQSEIVKKKVVYVGTYLAITVAMVLLTLILPVFDFEDKSYLHFVKIAMFGSLGGFISLNFRLEEIEFEIFENTKNYFLVSIYKLAFAMVSSIISYFLIESDLILSVFKNGSENYIYVEYMVAALAGFSERLLPNIFSSFEKEVSK